MEIGAISDARVEDAGQPEGGRTIARVVRLVRNHFSGAGSVDRHQLGALISGLGLPESMVEDVARALARSGFVVATDSSGATEAPLAAMEMPPNAPAVFKKLRRDPRRLLRADEERSLARLVQDGASARRLLAEGSADERGVLERRIHDGELAGRELEMRNLRLVHWVARRYGGRGLPHEDLFQEGWFGLRRAVEKFDPELGLKFSTYATWWVRQAVTRAIADKSRAVRLPVHVVEELERVIRARDAVLVETGRTCLDEIATRARLPVSRVAVLLRLARGPVSLDWQLGDGLNTLGDLIPDRRVGDANDSAEQQEILEALRLAISDLPAREAEILHRRFGLEGSAVETLEEIGHTFGLTRERIRQLEKRAILVLARDRTLRKVSA